jgi:hypothetical protein
MPVTPVVANDPPVDPSTLTTTSLPPNAPESHIEINDTSNKNDKKVLTSKKMPEHTIVWWTRPALSAIAPVETVVDDLDPPPQFGNGLPFSISDCGLPYTCTFTDDRTTITSTTSQSRQGNVILLSASNLDLNDLPPEPPMKDGQTNQAWVLNTGKT